ncbi:hypothetical protein RG963_16025 [Methanosarcina sp. Z-7115]|uniref:Acidic integral membrane protein n=1 Tax=Methanosarcina baikalica TaxID=3073890 RepID=A0ABU2D5J6_9EURY|nr:hypothetical protein [Methanosarcina sp. Z-7115]MDR7667254.1 hypothetical protein [Methanosarcina sp. Z-7115]
MKKMLKIIAMLLVIATVIFSAGCAEKAETGNETGASEEVTAESPVSEDGGNDSVVAPEEVAAVDNTTEEVAAEDNATDIEAEVVNEDDAESVVVASADNETAANDTADSEIVDNETADNETVV